MSFQSARTGIHFAVLSVLVFSALFNPCLAASKSKGRLDTVTVAYHAVAQELILDGVVEAINQATMSAQASGQVLEVNFDVDDFVKEGQVLAKFKNVQQKASLGQSEAQLVEAKAMLSATEKEYSRLKQLYAKNAISAASMDKTVADLEVAHAKVEAVKAAMSQAEEQVEYTVVRAPYSGIVLERHLELGEIASPGKPVMTGFSLEALRVTTTVPQNQIAAIRKYQKAQIFFAESSAERQFDSQKITIAPYADSKTHTFKVRLDLPPKVQEIYPGMYAKVAFTTGQEKRLMIPATTVAYRSEVKSVYVVDGKNQIYMRHIRTGETYLGMIEVLAGLEAGEQIAINPIKAVITLKQQRLEAESKLTPVAH